jgi:hypothetical protein
MLKHESAHKITSRQLLVFPVPSYRIWIFWPFQFAISNVNNYLTEFSLSAIKQIVELKIFVDHERSLSTIYQ